LNQQKVYLIRIDPISSQEPIQRNYEEAIKRPTATRESDVSSHVATTAGQQALVEKMTLSQPCGPRSPGQYQPTALESRFLGSQPHLSEIHSTIHELKHFHELFRDPIQHRVDDCSAYLDRTSLLHLFTLQQFKSPDQSLQQRIEALHTELKFPLVIAKDDARGSERQTDNLSAELKREGDPARAHTTQLTSFLLSLTK
jgi:hypothetical protein